MNVDLLMLCIFVAEDATVSKRMCYKAAYQEREVAVERDDDGPEEISEWTGLYIDESARAAEDRSRWRSSVLQAENHSSGGRHWTTTMTLNGGQK